MGDSIKLNIQENAAYILISNPERRNALSFGMWTSILEIAEELKRQESVRVAVIQGEGQDFSAGSDISQMARGELTGVNVNQYMEKCKRALEALPFPVLAVLRGYVMGAGVELALACDMRIASASAKLGIPAAKRGIGIALEDTAWLVRLVGQARAMEILCLGETISAATAMQWGLLNEVINDEEMETRVHTWVNALSANAPLTIAAAKKNVLRSMFEPVLEKPDPADICAKSDDVKEGIQAFMEKRNPVFHGR